MSDPHPADEVATKLQAVVLCDAVFSGREENVEKYRCYGLQPLSKEIPQILCRLNNVPVVDYIMEFLASNHVEQVMLITNNESTQVEDYLRCRQSVEGSTMGTAGVKNTPSSSSQLVWSDPGSGHLELFLLKDTSLLNAGDALRELYKRNWIITGKNAKPFVLVQGNVIAYNIPLLSILQSHRTRVYKDATAMFTCIFQPKAQTLTINDLCVGLVPVVMDDNAAAATATKNNIMDSDNDNNNNSNNNNNNVGKHQNDYRVFVYDNHPSQSHITVPCSFVLGSQSPCTITTTATTTTTTSSATSSAAAGGGGLTFRTDLIDTGIYICSADVLGKFEDEFDYLDIANDFLANSVAEEEEGLQTRIYAHVLDPKGLDDQSSLIRIQPHNGHSYVARVMDFASYHSISRDLLQRWAYPMVPDSHVRTSVSTCPNRSNVTKETTAQRIWYKLIVDHTTRRLYPNRTVMNNDPLLLNPKQSSTSTIIHLNKYQYKESLHPTKVGRSSVCYGPGMMGSRGSIGEHCVIQQSVLGNSVHIGNHCTIINCHIWDDVVLHDNVNIQSTVIAQGCVIHSGAVIPKGCILGPGCIVGSNVQLMEFTRITLMENDEADDDGNNDDHDLFGDDHEDWFSEAKKNSNSTEAAAVSAVRTVTDSDILGKEGKGRVWHPPNVEDDDDDDDDDSDDGDINDEDDDDDRRVPSLDKDYWLQLQSIGGNPAEYYAWRQKIQENAALQREENDDNFSDDENDDDFAGLDGLTESEAFSAYTDGAFTFGAESGGVASPMAAPTSAAPVIGRQKGIDVVKEMTEICMEFDDLVFPVENLSIELNSYKFSQNATYSDCTMASTLALLLKMDINPDMTDGRLVATLKTKLEDFWATLLQKMSVGIPEEMSIIHALELAAAPTTSNGMNSNDKQALEAIATKLKNGMSFRLVLQTMHDEDVLSEEAILKWAEERKQQQQQQGIDEHASPRMELFQSQPVQEFLQWLEEEEEEDSEEQDDDESEED